MRINHNISALNTWRNQLGNNKYFAGANSGRRLEYRQFNTMNLLNVANAKQDEIDLTNRLKTSWLGQAEQRIIDYLGIQADGATMTVFYDRGGTSDGVGGKVAYVQASIPAVGGGLGTSLELHVDMADYDAGVAEDSIVAHEILHAVFDRTLNVGQGTGLSQSADKWFNEGVAEFIRGAVLDRTNVVPDGAKSVQFFNMVYPSTAANELQLQIGANTNQTFAVGLTKSDSTALGIDKVNVVTNAQSAIGAFDSAIQIVSEFRSKFGAIQNRLEHALQMASNSEENLTSSESRIRDADMAKEMMKMTKMNILSQATTAMFAQANQSNQSILQILH